MAHNCQRAVWNKKIYKIKEEEKNEMERCEERARLRDSLQ